MRHEDERRPRARRRHGTRRAEAERVALPEHDAPGLHVAVIMDGSGRWAEAKHLSRMDGHRAGAESVRRIVDAAPPLGVATLTLFAFSSDNWKRPRSEVDALMDLLTHFLTDFHHDAARTGVCIDVIGRRDRLAPPLLAAIDTAEASTRRGQALHLRLAVDYSGREAIVRAAQHVARGAHAAPQGVPPGRTLSDNEARDAFREALATVVHACRPAPEVDLLIRTGGERRLSDFLLWECAYAELYFTACMWPAFGVDDLRQAIGDFRARERRFGDVSQASHV